MNHFQQIRLLVYLVVLLPGLITGQEKVKLIPEGAAEPEHLKERYEGNSRVSNRFRPADIRPSTPEETAAAANRRQEMQKTSLLKNYPVRNIGPAVMSGRVSDVAVNERNPKIYYVGYSSGGVFKTVNNGNTFEPVFDHQRALGIGDIALAPSNPDLLWVGTGENNASRSSYAGAGVYKSSDGGKTWQFTGLGATQHIGRIVVHPSRPEVVWVAAIGALYSADKNRGLYKTTDGGLTWKQTLFLNDSTGVIDLVVNPQNPDQLWAASWQRMRNAGNFVGNGNGSAIFISNDGGETWQKSMNGFPDGRFVGRIGLDVCLSKPSILYAVLDNQEEIRKEKKPQAKGAKAAISGEVLRDMNTELFLNLPNTDLDTFLVQKNFPNRYNSSVVKDDVKKGKYLPKALYEYLGEENDANTNLFETSIKGAEVYRSDDYGKSWRKVNMQSLDGMYYTYGYYFGQIRVAPGNPDRVFTWGVPLLVSSDGGRTFTVTDTIGRVHADHHAMWINPADNEHIINGNDGGVNVSHDGGRTWSHQNQPPVGQFYTVMVDMEKPYNVYGGLQDNGVYYGSSKSVPGKSKDWQPLMGGDGMMVAVDPGNSNLVYTGFQYGNYFRISKNGGKPVAITPKHEIGEPTLRWNWRTPLVMSRHNPEILYMGSQRLHRSLNGAQSWETISPDLTKNKMQGNVPFSTITAIAESSLKFGLLYVGTDDGNIQLSRNGGSTWELVNSNLPPDLWVSSIFPSGFEEGTVYATLTGYRYDHFKAYLFKSVDYGKSWKSVAGNLPDECANVIVEDPVNRDLLYAGTDHGTYVTMDGGTIWHLFSLQMPNVANYDMMVHPRDNELVMATHGRSMYIADVKPLQALRQEKLEQPIMAFDPERVQHSKKWGEREYAFEPPNEPSVMIHYYVGEAGNKPVSVEITDAAGKTVRLLTGPNEKGFQSVKWDLRRIAGKARKGVEPRNEYIQPGTYKVKLQNGTASAGTQVVVK